MLNIEREIAPLKEQLESHSIYRSVSDMQSLRVFMEHHVYSVWDFMSLVKYLQNEFAPSTFPWTPPSNKKLARFLNEIVLGEESDDDNANSHASHFELYCLAMNEVKANSDLAWSFVNDVKSEGLDEAFNSKPIPVAAKKFMLKTFDFITSGKPHIVAAAFAFGRETVIPMMFQVLINKMNIKKEDAPTFHYYLERHIELDGDEHGPLALEIIETLCGDNPKNWEEALQAAKESIEARIELWNEVEREIFSLKSLNQQSL